MKTDKLTGNHVGVAVLDTGIFTHIDFGCRIRAFCDMVHGEEHPYDDNGHGTHVDGSQCPINFREGKNGNSRFISKTQ